MDKTETQARSKTLNCAITAMVIGLLGSPVLAESRDGAFTTEAIAYIRKYAQPKLRHSSTKELFFEAPAARAASRQDKPTDVSHGGTTPPAAGTAPPAPPPAEPQPTEDN